MLQRGEDIIIGVAAEETRGTPVVPQIYVPGRTPSGISAVVEKVPVKETRGTKVESHSSEIVSKHAEGDFEFNLRVESIGFFLKSLLGNLQSAPVGGQSGVYDHTLEILLNDPEHPSLTFGLSQPANQDYEYPLSVISEMQLKVSPDDLVSATAKIIAKKEQNNSSGSPYSPTFLTRDYFFRQQDITIKMASNVAGLGAAVAMSVKELGLTLPNGARVDQNIGELNPGNVIALLFAMKGSMSLELEDTTLHDQFTAGSYAALQIVMTRSDITIGTSAHPTITITFPRISLEKWEPDRPLDDVVMQKLEFAAHYDADQDRAVQIVIRNQRADYTPAQSGS